jgi:hypothetical protein
MAKAKTTKTTKSTKSKYTDTDLGYMVKTIKELSSQHKRNIVNIVKEMVPNASIHEFEGGCKFNFHVFEDDVYDKISEYIEICNNAIDKELINYTQSEIAHEEDDHMSKMSNREMQLINRHKFDKLRTEENEQFIKYTQDRVMNTENTNTETSNGST